MGSSALIEAGYLSTSLEAIFLENGQKYGVDKSINARATKARRGYLQSIMKIALPNFAPPT
jgi:hypothetical protein